MARQALVVDEQRAEYDLARAGGKGGLGVGSARRPPPVCTGTSTASQIRSMAVEIFARAEGTVQVDDVKTERAGVYERFGTLDRIAIVLVVVVGSPRFMRTHFAAA